MSKITKATFKSFLKKNEGKLYIKTISGFDAMSDCVVSTEDNGYTLLKPAAYVHENNLGYEGVWLVGGSDSFEPSHEGDFNGIKVYNCCGSFTLAVQ